MQTGYGFSWYPYQLKNVDICVRRHSRTIYFIRFPAINFPIKYPEYFIFETAVASFHLISISAARHSMIPWKIPVYTGRENIKNVEICRKLFPAKYVSFPRTAHAKQGLARSEITDEIWFVAEPLTNTRQHLRWCCERNDQYGMMLFPLHLVHET